MFIVEGIMIALIARRTLFSTILSNIIVVEKTRFKERGLRIYKSGRHSGVADVVVDHVNYYSSLKRRRKIILLILYFFIILSKFNIF